MIELTRRKFEETSEYIKSVLGKEILSYEVNESTGIKITLDSLNSGSFQIALLAPFSAGKSTFINSLLGFDLLSTSILAETATITTIKYGHNPRAEVNYHDGSQFEIEGDKDDLFTFKEAIKEYIAVNHSNDEAEVETKIEEVVIYWPIDLCKSGVEIKDTPGLFSRHEKHKNITEGIINAVNAVIFMIDPATVGEENFMKIIREYVKSAKNLTLDNSDKHIFFVINKVDKYPDSEVRKAYEELKKVLSEVTVAPKIFKISSYFGLISKMYEEGLVALTDIQRDEMIKFVDDEGYPVAGRNIRESDIHQIRKIGNIESIYNSLGVYFEEKNGYLINDIFQKLNRALKIEIEETTTLISTEEKSYNDDSNKVKNQAALLEADFNQQISKLRREIEELVEGAVLEQSNNQSIMNKLRRLYNTEVSYIVKDVANEVKREWRQSKRKIGEHNAEDIINDFFYLEDMKIENTKLQVNQESFTIISKRLDRIVSECEELVQEMEQRFKRDMETKLGISRSEISFFDFSELLDELRREVERSFKGNAASEINDNINSNINDLKHNNEHTRLAPGVWNKFKSWFGKGKKITEFDLEGFISDIDAEVANALGELEAELTATIRQAYAKISDILKGEIFNAIEEHLLNARIDNYKKMQKELLDALIHPGEKTKEEFERKMSELKSRKQELEYLLEESRVKHEEINNMKEMEMV